MISITNIKFIFTIELTIILYRFNRIITRSHVGLQGIMQTSDHSSKPKGILFFADPTGVGKTELAKQLTEFVFGDQ